MKKEILQIPEPIKIVGLSVRTNNKNEADPAVAKISPTVQLFFAEDISKQIPHRDKPGYAYGVYSDYASDEHGDYNYTIGEKVSSFDGAPTSLKQITVPAGKYAKFTTEPGPMPMVLIKAWQEIWRQSPAELGGKRTYKVDLQLVLPAHIPNLSIIEIYLGIS